MVLPFTTCLASRGVTELLLCASVSPSSGEDKVRERKCCLRTGPDTEQALYAFDCENYYYLSLIILDLVALGLEVMKCELKPGVDEEAVKELYNRGSHSAPSCPLWVSEMHGPAQVPSGPWVLKLAFLAASLGLTVNRGASGMCTEIFDPSFTCFHFS